MRYDASCTIKHTCEICDKNISEEKRKIKKLLFKMKEFKMKLFLEKGSSPPKKGNFV